MCLSKQLMEIVTMPPKPGPCANKVCHKHVASYLCPERKPWAVPSALFMCSHATVYSGLHYSFWSGPWQCNINLEMYNIVLLGLVKHNPDPQWNLERKQYKGSTFNSKDNRAEHNRKSYAYTVHVCIYNFFWKGQWTYHRIPVEPKQCCCWCELVNFGDAWQLSLF